MNRTIQTLIKNYVSSAQDDWDTILPYILFSIRVSCSEANGESPYFVLFGRDPCFPVDLNFKDVQPTGVHDVKNQIPALVQHFHSVWHNARSLAKASQAMYDVKARESKLCIGDKVRLKVENFAGKCKKLSPRWHGPFRVLDLNDFNASIVPLNALYKEPRVVHQNRLKIHFSMDLPEFRPESQKKNTEHSLQTPQNLCKNQSQDRDPAQKRKRHKKSKNLEKSLDTPNNVSDTDSQGSISAKRAKPDKNLNKLSKNCKASESKIHTADTDLKHLKSKTHSKKPKLRSPAVSPEKCKPSTVQHSEIVETSETVQKSTHSTLEPNVQPNVHTHAQRSYTTSFSPYFDLPSQPYGNTSKRVTFSEPLIQNSANKDCPLPCENSETTSNAHRMATRSKTSPDGHAKRRRYHR